MKLLTFLIASLMLISCTMQNDPNRAPTLPDDVNTPFVSYTHAEKTLVNTRVANVLNGLNKTIGPDVQTQMVKSGVKFPAAELKIIAIKDELVLEVWGRNDNERNWHLIKKYPFTAYSGGLGPKLKEGDRQIPEGVYKISHLNPDSSYHLSLRVDYPNVQDVLQAQRDGRSGLGGDIFIHGDEKTIGCIPLGDANIEELFYMVGWTGEANTGVIISPYDFRKLPLKNPTSLPWMMNRYADIREAMLRVLHGA